MRRREDSDHSISDEDYDYDWAENRVSLAAVTSKKEGLAGIASKLELLTGTRDAHVEEKAAHFEDAGFFSEDEVEIPEFYQEGQSKDSKDAKSNFPESVCVASCHESQIGRDGSSALYASRANASLKSYRQSTRCNLNSRRFLQRASSGDGDDFLQVAKSTGSSSHHFVQLESGADEDQDLSISNNPLSLRKIMKAEHLSTHTSDSALGCSHGEMMRESEHGLRAEGDSRHCYSKLSIAELLDNLQEKNGGSKVTPKIKRPIRRGKRPVNQSNSNRGKKFPDDQAPCELPMDSESSDHDEGFGNCPALRIKEADRDTKPKSKTMADQFQEVIGASNMNDDPGLVSGVNRMSGCSGVLLGRLQRVVQWEKEQDLTFLKSVQPEPSDKLRCIDAKVLSRSFSGKLTTCHCSVDETRKGSPWAEDADQERLPKERTIIFNSRVCGHVELEVGTSVRIYHPWKELRLLGSSEVIVLASYFSHI